MQNFNRVIISGHLGKDPETATTGDTTKTSFSLAVTDKWSDKAGEKQEHTNWLPVIVWNGRGENVQQFLSKGSHVLVEGSLRVTSWDDTVSGQKRWKTEIVASNIVFLDKRPPETQTTIPTIAGRRKKAS